MLKAVIIDDELNNISNLERLLALITKKIMIVGSAQNMKDGEYLIRKSKPDIVFLDIEMPEGSGFDLLDRCEDLKFECVFVTAYDQYALQAIKKKAFDYLLKPIDLEELLNCVHLLEERIHQNQHDKNEIHDHHLITLPSLNGFEVFKTEEIKYILSNGNYCEFHFTNSPKLIVSKNIGEFEKVLPPSIFVRIHNEHIININEIKQYYKGRGGYVIMKDGKNLAVSSRNKTMFLESLFKKGH